MTALPPDLEAQLSGTPGGWVAVAILGLAALCFWLAAVKKDIVPLMALVIVAGFIGGLLEATR